MLQTNHISRKKKRKREERDKILLDQGIHRSIIFLNITTHILNLIEAKKKSGDGKEKTKNITCCTTYYEHPLP